MAAPKRWLKELAADVGLWVMGVHSFAGVHLAGLEELPVIGVLASPFQNTGLAMKTFLDYRGNDFAYTSRLITAALLPKQIVRSGSHRMTTLLYCGRWLARVAAARGLADSESHALRYPLTDDLLEMLHFSDGQTEEDRRIRLAYVGPPRPERGCFDLVLAFRRTARADPNVRLHLFLRLDSPSDVRLARILISMVRNLELKDRVVVFTRRLEKAELRSRVQACDFAVFPYRYVTSCWPVGLLETLGLGVPVIATDIGPVSEFVSEDCAILCEPGNVNALAEAISILLSDPELRRRHGEHARKAVGSLPGRENAYREAERAVEALGTRPQT